ncbi:MAG: class I SAM-dependent methyltransferase [Candidatus Latescibacteria bacterium]|jgi:SAM-dependent methyltransferase|nr:class I SAM-dependent methyltransferase [Candidatus Latescibacterota bacterium]
MDADTKRALVQAYDSHAQERDQSTLPEWKRAVRAAFLELVRAEGRTTLLEIGAGTGISSRFYQENGLRVVAIDLSPVMVRFCRDKSVPALRMDTFRLGFRPGSFEAVWALNCLLHVPKRDLPGVLSEIRAVMKPGGLFYLGQWGGSAFEGVWEDDHYDPKRFFSFQTDEEIAGTVGRWFESVSFKGFRPGDGEAYFQSMVWRCPR